MASGKGFWRKIGQVVDYVGGRLLVLLAVVLVGFVVTQPFIWKLRHLSPIPQKVSNLASLMALVVTIMALGLAGLGIGTYRLVRQRLLQDLEREGRSIRDDFGVRVARARGALSLDISLQAHLAYEQLWEQQGYAEAALQDLEISRELKSALRHSETALEVFEKLPAELQSREECVTPMRILKGNVAYFLATEGNQDLKKRALGYVNELEKLPATWNRRETVAWVCLRYGRDDEKLWKRGIARLAEVLADEDLEDATAIRFRYAGVFAMNLGLFGAALRPDLAELIRPGG